MARGKIGKKHFKKGEQYEFVSDMKLRLTLGVMADKYNQQIQQLIYKTYSDLAIQSIYRGIRLSGAFQHGSKDKSKRKIIEFPNAYVYDFCDTVLTELYGPNWLKSNKALKHELVRQWWVVEKL